MRETGILYTPENYTKTERGDKTMTRRIIKLTCSGRIKLAASSKNWHPSDPNAIHACPFGMVGDRLYVKEGLQKSPGGLVQYRRDPPKVIGWAEWTWDHSFLSPMFMPKWAARLWLELTDVRVERLCECSSEDALAEGAGDWQGECSLREKRLNKPQLQFAALWDSIHGPGSWELNPWVWVIEYKKVAS